MLKITRFTCENLESGCVTDRANPCFSYTVFSDRENAAVKSAVLSVNGCEIHTTKQVGITYEGKSLEPFTSYEA